MKNIRIIPRLDIKGSNVVKPVQTEALRVVGDPRSLAVEYYRQGADEIIYLDIVASLYQRSIDFDLLKDVTKEIFIPVTVGGGIRSIQDVKNVLHAGADKVAINTYALRHPEFLQEAVHKFGSQCIMLSVEAKKQFNGSWEAYTDGGREHSGQDAIKWIKKALDMGIGEILLTSIDQEGRKKGYDLDLIKAVAAFSPVPIIAHGGAGNLGSIGDAVFQGGADAVAMSSLLHYRDFTVGDIKGFLWSQGINVRKL